MSVTAVIYKIYDTLPLVSPAALKGNTCVVNDSLIHKRVALVAIAAFAAIAMATGIALQIKMVILPLSVGLIFAIEKWRAARAANRKAVEEFIKFNQSEDVLERLASSYQAAKLLVSKGGDLNYSTSSTRTALNFPKSFAVFKIYIDGQVDAKKGFDWTQSSWIEKAASHPDPAYLAYLLKAKAKSADFDPRSFTKEQQMFLWLSAPTVNHMVLLRNHGFDPNLDHDKTSGLLCRFFLRTINDKLKRGPEFCLQAIEKCQMKVPEKFDNESVLGLAHESIRDRLTAIMQKQKEQTV